jgi:ADP-heptose:LPS heptosyltransferase
VISRILVIKLGALGDFVQALGPMQAIRRAHKDAHVALLTTAPFVGLAAASPYFDSVMVDTRPRNPFDLWRLRKLLRGGKFDRIYDLQTSDRSSFYFRLMFPSRPEWSGIAAGGSHRHANSARDTMHTIDRQADQLAGAGIASVPAPDLDWVRADLAQFDLGPRYAMLVPGASPHRPAKRWPVERYADLARVVAQRGARPVVVGTADERDLGAHIAAACPETRDLTGRTGLLELFAVAKGASAAIGNDSGPMHMAALGGTPSVVLFSAESDPALCAPRGSNVTVLRRSELAGLTVGEVAAALRLR